MIRDYLILYRARRKDAKFKKFLKKQLTRRVQMEKKGYFPELRTTKKDKI